MLQLGVCLFTFVVVVFRDVGKMDQELFDVILSTLTEKGHIHAWKSELMYQAVRPMYESGVLPRIKVGNGEKGDPEKLLKLRLLMDLLNKLGLNYTRKMLLTEVDEANEVDLDSGLDRIVKEKAEDQEPYLQTLWRLSGKTKEADQSTTDQSILPENNRTTNDPETTQDLFETAIDMKIDEMTLEDSQNQSLGLE